MLANVFVLVEVVLEATRREQEPEKIFREPQDRVRGSLEQKTSIIPGSVAGEEPPLKTSRPRSQVKSPSTAHTVSFVKARLVPLQSCHESTI